MKLRERKFENLLDGLIDMEIGLLLSDNQFIKGVLLDVKHDYLVVEVNQIVYYFALQHIQALSKNAKNFHISSKMVPFIEKKYLVDVLKELRHNWVSINSLSDQALFGVLSRISDDHITVINNSEILYIPHSNISNISKEQIIINKKQEQLEIQNCEIVEQMTSDHTQKIKEIARITTVEAPILEISAGEVTGDENVSSEQPEVDPNIRVEIYAALLKVIKHNLLNRDIENEQREDIIQEKAIQGIIVHIDDETKEQSDSLIVEMQDCQFEGEVAIEHTQTINETKPIKKLETPLIENTAREGIEFENVNKENPEASSQLVKHDLLKRIDEYSLEVDQPGVLESTNQVSRKEQLLPRQSRGKRKKKRLLLTAWSTMNNDSHAIANHENIAKENEIPDCERDSIKMEQTSEPINSLMKPLHDQYPKENFVNLEEKLDSAETTIIQLPIAHINPKEEKKMLEKQYYALMKQAETNCVNMTEKHINLSEEGQYLALMKHAAKKYREYKE